MNKSTRTVDRTRVGYANDFDRSTEGSRVERLVLSEVEVSRNSSTEVDSFSEIA